MSRGDCPSSGFHRPVCITLIRRGSRRDQPEHMEQTGQGADRVCPAAEAEQKDTILALESVHQECIGIADVACKAVPERQPDGFRPKPCDTVECVGRPHGAQPSMVVGHLSGRVIEIEHGMDMQFAQLNLTLGLGCRLDDGPVYGSGQYTLRKLGLFSETKTTAAGLAIR